MKSKVYTIGQICSRFSSGKNITAKSIGETGLYPVYGGNGLRGYTSTSNFKGECSIIGRQGAYCGNVKYIDGEAYMSEHAIVAVTNNEHDNRYFSYKLGLLKLGRFSGQAAQPGLSVGMLSKLRMEMPSLSIQKKIASILSAYYSLIENNKKRIKLLEQMAENLYKEWFVRFRFPGHETAEFEGGVPKGWKRVSLREYANVIMGQSPESCFYNTEKLGLPFHQGCGSYGEFYLRDDIYSTEGKRIAEPNSIIFSVRAPVGRINLTLNKIILGRGVAGINAKNNNNAFLLWLLKQKFSKEDIIGNGAIFTSVTKNELLGQKLLIPNKELERKFNVIASNIETEIKLLTLQKEVLTTQRDLLLPRLMSGKLSI